MEIVTPTYHQAYYEKNKERLREKAREREKRKRLLAKAFVRESTKAEPASPTENNESGRLQAVITAYSIPPLLLISTFLMIREMANVYSETWGTLGAILIALAIEGFTLLFSFVQAPYTALKIGLRGLAVTLALGSIFGMSAKHYSTGLASYRADEVTQRQIEELETAIKRKQSQSDVLFAKHWIGAARKLEKQIDSMRLELTQLRSSIAHAKPANAVAPSTLFEIFIRFALAVCNIVAAHLFGESLKKFESFKPILENPRIEIGVSKPTHLKLLRLINRPQEPVYEGIMKGLREVFGLSTDHKTKRAIQGKY